MSAPPIERTRFIIVFSRVRAPRNAQSWGLGPPPSTCAQTRGRHPPTERRSRPWVDFACRVLCPSEASHTVSPRTHHGQLTRKPTRGAAHDAVTLGDDCVGVLALLQGTIKLRRSAAARPLAASRRGGDLWTLLDPPCFPSLPTGSQCPKVSTHPPQPARGVPRVRDPQVVEGPTRPICPTSDPVSCLPHPRDVVLAPLPYQDITHRTRNRLTTPLRAAGELPSPLL